jgi:hypothetical protein
MSTAPTAYATVGNVPVAAIFEIVDYTPDHNGNLVATAVLEDGDVVDLPASTVVAVHDWDAYRLQPYAPAI